MWDEGTNAGADRKNGKSGSYSIGSENGLDFLSVSWDGGAREKFLYLVNGELNDLYLYKSDSGPFFGRFNSSSGGFAVFGDTLWIRASSSFQETLGGKTVIYSPDNLGEKIGECWVPGKGLNERLTLSISPRHQMEGGNIYVSSGFVSFLKPYLYTENSRIKKIRLSDSSGKSKTVELKDTPHFQPVSIEGIGTNEDGNSVLTMEILEVYPGSKYDDICLNSICWRYKQ
jgi:hypothetical protein